eukprot:gene20488-26579_t
MDQVLPVNSNELDVSFLDSLGNIVDLNSLTAEQYLAWVRYQAESIPDVTVASIDKVQLVSNNQTNTITLANVIEECPESFKPDKDWENNVLKSFSDLRLHIERLSLNLETRERKIAVPLMKDTKSWHLFCFGELLMNDCEDSNGEMSVDDNNDETSISESEIPIEESNNEEELTNVVEWKGLTNVEPNISLLLQFDQVMVTKVLIYHIQWLDDKLLTNSRSKWLYSLLSRLEKPLHRDVEAMIRQLYRRCCQLRYDLWVDVSSNKVNIDDDNQLAQLNTLILICGKYFGQGEYYRTIDSLLIKNNNNNHNDRSDDNNSEEEFDNQLDENISSLIGFKRKEFS